MIETWRNKRMVVEIVGMIPERVAENRTKLIALKRRRQWIE